jgi:hypothetical protein
MIRLLGTAIILIAVPSRQCTHTLTIRYGNDKILMYQAFIYNLTTGKDKEK